ELRLIWKIGGSKLSRVGSLEDVDPRIVPKAPVELAVAHVKGDHAGRAPPEQAVGEPAGGGAYVETGASVHLDPEVVEAALELQPPARDVSRLLVDEQLRVVRNEL